VPKSWETDLKEQDSMPVIGRLDKQVEEVLIAPIARRHERETQEERVRAEKRSRKEEAAQAGTEKSDRAGTEKPGQAAD